VPGLIVRTLAREYRLHSDSDAAIADFAFVEASPEVAGVSLVTVDLPLTVSGAFYRLRMPDGALVDGTREYLIAHFLRALGSSVEEESGGGPLLHAATAIRNGARAVFVGDGGHGKTTLMLRLLQEGFAVEGDELVLVDAGAARAMPRRLRVKEGTLAVLPDLAAVIRAAPAIAEWNGGRVYSMVPDLNGAGWRIAPSAVRDLFFIEPNHGGSSVLSPLAPDLALAKLLSAAIMPTAGKAVAAMHLRRLVQGARSWRLQLGDLGRALWHLKKQLG
jgi:hypothetical protein